MSWTLMVESVLWLLWHQGIRSINADQHQIMPGIIELINVFIPLLNKVGAGHTGFTLSVRPSVCPSVCRWHGFRSISQVCFGVSISNFIRMFMVAIGRSLSIFNYVTFKMAAWRPYFFLANYIAGILLWKHSYIWHYGGPHIFRYVFYFVKNYCCVDILVFITKLVINCHLT